MSAPYKIVTFLFEAQLAVSYNLGQKSWDAIAFLGRFPIHKGPTPPLTPQTMLDACVQNFLRVSTMYRVGGERNARKFRKGCTVLRGNREVTEKYEYCSTVPGLQITAGQRTMSGQNWVLTGQILGLPDILSGPLPTRSKKF